MISVNKAIKIILSQAKALPKEKISSDNSLGRILSKNIYAKINNPPENVSSMDGYAVKYSNLKNLNKNPIKVIGESSAGRPFINKIKDKECIRIFTGAVVPNSTNVILLQERVKIINNYIVKTTQNYKTNQYIRNKGSNFKKNKLLVKKNSFINSRILGLIVSSNNEKISVFQKPKVAILATGNELKLLGKSKRDGIISSNSSLLTSMFKSFGTDTTDLGIARDNIKSLESKLKNINNYNILITTGGASVGKHDLVKDVLIKLGMKLIFWKVAMRPGKPLIFGKLNNTLILGFPGNPVSTYVSALIFAKPLINKFVNMPTSQHLIKATLVTELNKNDKRQEYLRAVTTFKNNNYYVSPFKAQDSSMTFDLSEANCLIIRKAFDKQLKSGDQVTIIILSNINSSI